MRHQKLTGPPAGAAEGRNMRTVGGEPVHTGIAVSVGHKQLTGGSDADVCRVIEGSLERCLIAGAQGSHQLAISGVFQHLVGIAVHEVNGVIRADVNMVSVGGHTLPPEPGGEQIAVPVEYQHRRPLPLKDVDAIIGINSHTAGALEVRAGRQLGPFRPVFVNVVSHTDDY